MYGLFVVLRVSQSFFLPLNLPEVVVVLVFVTPMPRKGQVLPEVEFFHFMDFRDLYVVLLLPRIALNFLSYSTLALFPPHEVITFLYVCMCLEVLRMMLCDFQGIQYPS